MEVGSHFHFRASLFLGKKTPPYPFHRRVGRLKVSLDMVVTEKIPAHFW